MRYILIHKTEPRWERGEIPSRELIAQVGKLLGELSRADAFRGGEGLRSSALGVRVRFSGGERVSLTRGPLQGENELPAGFSIVRTGTLEEATEWATRLGKVFGEVEFDIRPVTEPWDIGMAPRPEGLKTQRYMLLRKATSDSESVGLSEKERAALDGWIAEAGRSGVHVATETMRPSRRGRRYKNSQGGMRTIDGPFTESKELIAGYAIVEAASLDEACRWALRYIDCVGSDEVDVRELE